MSKPLVDVKDVFVPSGQPIVHGEGNPQAAVQRQRMAEPIDRYCSRKITELAMMEIELGRVARERDALHRMLSQLVAAKDEKDANGESSRYVEMKRGLWERARETLAKFASGELRKP